MRLISTLPCTDYGQHCIFVFHCYYKANSCKKEDLKCLEKANEGDQDLIQLCLKIDSILSLFHLAWDIFVIHWCCTSWQGKKQKKVVHSEPNLNGVTGPVVSSNTFSFWDFNIELTEPRKRWSPPISHEVNAIFWNLRTDSDTLTITGVQKKNSACLIQPKLTFSHSKLCWMGDVKKDQKDSYWPKYSCLKLFPWK